MMGTDVVLGVSVVGVGEEIHDRLVAILLLVEISLVFRIFSRELRHVD